MNNNTELPPDVIAEIEANRKVAAIKRLRAHSGLGLKEAREQVDDYIKAHPASPGARAQPSEGGIGNIIILIIGVGVIYALYKYLT